MATQYVGSDSRSKRPPKRSSRFPFPPRRARRRSYRVVFSSSKSAVTYDDRVYAPGSSSELLWRVEAAIIGDLVAAMRHTHGRIDYLDFACGTGRVLVHLEPRVDSPTGIDVSPFMLERAAAKVVGALLVCKDISAPDDIVEGRYDLITAFRFLTNAEPGLRDAALAGLRRRMKDEASVLLINTHGNPWSYRALLLPYHWLRDRRRGRSLFGYMSRREARHLLAEAGFAVERIIGMGFLPEKLLPCVPRGLALWLERHLAGIPLLQACGLNQLFICRPRLETGIASLGGVNDAAASHRCRTVSFLLSFTMPASSLTK